MTDNLEYDEDMAVKFIRNFVGEKISDQYSDDEILYVIDIIWDYYEREGLTKLNASFSEDATLDEDALVAYVRKELANDHELLMDPADLPLIVKGELEYEDSLENA